MNWFRKVMLRWQYGNNMKFVVIEDTGKVTICRLDYELDMYMSIKKLKSNTLKVLYDSKIVQFNHETELIVSDMPFCCGKRLDHHYNVNYPHHKVAIYIMEDDNTPSNLAEFMIEIELCAVSLTGIFKHIPETIYIKQLKITLKNKNHLLVKLKQPPFY